MLWVCLQLTGPVRWLRAAECAALQRRCVQQAILGAATSPHAAASVLLACAATLRSATLELPPCGRWPSGAADALNALSERCDALRSLHVLPALTAAQARAADAADAAGAAGAAAAPTPAVEWPDWPAHTGEALLALLRCRRLRSLSLMHVAAPPATLAALGTAAGPSLRTLRLLPDSTPQLRAAAAGAAGLSCLRSLATSWHAAPRLLAAFLAASPMLTRLEVHFLRDYALPRGLERSPDALADLLSLGPDPPPAAHFAAAAAGIAALEAAGGWLELLPTAAQGELDACLLALARVAARAAAAAAVTAGEGESGGGSDWSAHARPLTLVSEGVAALSEEGVAAALRVYPRLTLAPPPADDAEEEEGRDDEIRVMRL